MVKEGGKKRKSAPEQWQRRVAQVGRKKKRLEAGPRRIPACRCVCKDKFTDEDQEQLHKAFWQLSGAGQTLYLRGCVVPVEKAAGRAVFKYKLEVLGTVHDVCQSAFTAILNITRAKLRGRAGAPSLCRRR